MTKSDRTKNTLTNIETKSDQTKTTLTNIETAVCHVTTVPFPGALIVWMNQDPPK